MKKIKVFLASSDELRTERLELNEMIKNLNINVYLKKGVDINLFDWETHDNQYRTIAKQEEYNENVRNCDLFIGIFWTKAGRFTVEEFEIARETYDKTQHSPAIFVFFKETIAGQEDETLLAFKSRLFNDLSHYSTPFTNIYKVQYDFVVNFMRLEVDGELKGLIVEDTEVRYDGSKICNMNDLSFASNNEERVRLINTISKLKKQVEKLLLQIDYDEDFRVMYNEKKAQLEDAEKELKIKDQSLISMSIDFARRTNSQISIELKEAKEAFERGDMKRVRELTSFDDIDKIISVKREYDLALNNKYELLLISRNATMEDSSISIENRIRTTTNIYEKLIVICKELKKDGIEYFLLMSEYALFAYKYANYDKAIEIFNAQISLSEKIYGIECSEKATNYNNLGTIYDIRSNYDQALECYTKSLNIEKKLPKLNYVNIAECYNNIGLVYKSKGDYAEALKFYLKSLSIKEKLFGTTWHTSIAISYNNIANINVELGNYDQALIQYTQVLNIYEELLGKEHFATATCYNNIGVMYEKKGELINALKYYCKALSIRKSSLGVNHPDIAQSYNNIAGIYETKKAYKQALKYYLRDLDICTKVYRDSHPDVAICYNNIATIYFKQGEYNKALEYYEKSLLIKEDKYGDNHTRTFTSYNNLGVLYSQIREFDKAEDCFLKCVGISQALFQKYGNKSNISIVETVKTLCRFYELSDQHEKALRLISDYNIR